MARVPKVSSTGRPARTCGHGGLQEIRQDPTGAMQRVFAVAQTGPRYRVCEASDFNGLEVVPAQRSPAMAELVSSIPEHSKPGRRAYRTTTLVDDIMRRWPATIRVFLDYRTQCVGCPIACFHTVDDACCEHALSDPALDQPCCDPPSASTKRRWGSRNVILWRPLSTRPLSSHALSTRLTVQGRAGHLRHVPAGDGEVDLHASLNVPPRLLCEAQQRVGDTPLNWPAPSLQVYGGSLPLRTSR